MDGIKYSLISGDKNKIHLDDITGYNSIFGKKICHGTLVVLNFIKKTNLIKLLKNINSYSLKINFNRPFAYNDNIYVLKNNKKIFQKNNGLASVIFKNDLPKNSLNKLQLIKNYKTKIKLSNIKFSHFNTLELILNHLSKYVGMVNPGKNSIISEINIMYNINFQENNYVKIYSKKPKKDLPIIFNSIKYKKFIVDFVTLKRPLLKRNKIKINNKIKKYVKNIKIPVLIIGASNGIGLEIFELIKLNKKIPIIGTYNQNKIRNNQKNISIIKLNINKDYKKIREIIKKYRHLRIYYFATPKIEISNNNSHNIKNYKNFYINYPLKIINDIKIDKLEFFYPSSIFVTNKHLSDYSNAKKLGEQSLLKINDNTKFINILRIDEINTKQNLNLINKHYPSFIEKLTKKINYQNKIFNFK